MGNACQGPTEADVHRHMCTVFDQPDCLVSQQNYCCSADDDCMDAFEYQRLEGDFPGQNPIADPLTEASNFPEGSECQLPRAALAAQRAEGQSANRAGSTQGFKQIKRNPGENVKLSPVDKPAA